MLLAIDIGNTNIVIGLFDNDHLRDHIRLATRPHMTADEAGLLMSQFLGNMGVSNENIDHVIICSVVPWATPMLTDVAQRYFGCIPTIVSHELKLPIEINIERPAELGADRIANAVAGFIKFGGPVIIVDFGTATTFDIVDDSGKYLGGVILPGPHTAMSELARKAARLFQVRIEPPDKVIGRSTQAALQSGMYYGTVAQTDILLEQIIEEGGFTRATIVATGGLAKEIQKHSRHMKLIEPTLTLDGLRLIEEANS